MQIQWIKRHGGRHSWSGKALEIRFGKVLLSRLGHRVIGSTGRPEQRAYLSELGAADMIERAALAASPPRPLDSERWAGAAPARR